MAGNMSCRCQCELLTADGASATYELTPVVDILPVLHVICPDECHTSGCEHAVGLLNYEYDMSWVK